MKKYEILHTAVGSFSRGDVVSEEMIKTPGVSMNRLKSLGAIREADDSTPIRVAGSAADEVWDDAEPEADPTQSLSDRIANASGDGIAATQTEEDKPSDKSAGGEKPEGAPSSATGDNLSGMTVPTLKQIAEGYGIEVTANMKKDELIAAITKAQEPDAEA